MTAGEDTEGPAGASMRMAQDASTVTTLTRRLLTAAPTHLRTGPTVSPQQYLKRTNSDPSLLKSSEERKTRWGFIRRQPEYRRMVWDMKVKQAFQEKQEEDGSETQEKGVQTDKAMNRDTRLDSTSSTQSESRVKLDNLQPGTEKRQKSRPKRPLTGILRTGTPEVGASARSSRQVHFDEGAPAVSSSGGVSRHTSTESLDTSEKTKSSSLRRSTRPGSAPVMNGNGMTPPGAKSGRKQLGANISLSGRSGVGQISLQMSDFYHPGRTKTMSVNYSSSVLLQNSRILSEDLIRLSSRKSEARQAFIKRTERRLHILRKNRELREQTKAERDRRKRMEEDEGDLDSAYFRRPEETLLSKPSAEMQEMLTISEKKEMRYDRIKERTMLLPENYRTANYIRDFGEEQAKTVGGANYLRSSQEDGQDETIAILPL